MKLSEIFSQLSAGELSQLSIGGGDQGVVDENNWAQLLGHINLGLTALFTRFALSEGRVVLNLIPDKLKYELHSDYAVSNVKSKKSPKYIQDAGDPFKDDILKVEQVLTDAGCEMGLNDGADEYSVTTPSLTTLRVHKDVVAKSADVPDYLKTDSLEIVYRANHPQIVMPSGYFDPAKVNVALPFSHLQALLFFVASRMTNPIGISNEMNMGNNYAMKYEAECQRLEAMNLETDSVADVSRFRRNGWI